MCRGAFNDNIRKITIASEMAIWKSVVKFLGQVQVAVTTGNTWQYLYICINMIIWFIFQKNSTIFMSVHADQRYKIFAQVTI